jgi:hypothetical protein
MSTGFTTMTTTSIRRNLIHSHVPLSFCAPSFTPFVRQPVSFFASSTGNQPKKPPIPEWKKPRPPIPPPPGLEDFKLRDEVDLDPSIHRKPLESHRKIVEDEQWARQVEREFFWRPYKSVAIGLAALLAVGAAVKVFMVSSSSSSLLLFSHLPSFLLVYLGFHFGPE